MVFNRNFWKFTLGFIVLVLFGLLGLLVTNYYGIVNKDDGIDNVGVTTRVNVK